MSQATCLHTNLIYVCSSESYAKGAQNDLEPGNITSTMRKVSIRAWDVGHLSIRAQPNSMFGYFPCNPGGLLIRSYQSGCGWPAFFDGT